MTSHKSIAFFDIDGTLLPASGKLSVRVKKSIFALREKGFHICLASGRPSFAAKTLIKELEIVDPCIFFSSAVIFDPVKNQPIEAAYLDPEQIFPFLAALRKAGIYSELYSTENYFSEQWTEFTDIHLTYVGIPPKIGGLDDVAIREKIVKATFVFQLDQKVFCESLIEKFPQFHFGVAGGAAHPHILFANATNPDFSRKIVFEKVLNLLQVSPDRTIAFGDGESDITFLSLSGWGVAMGNAADKVKQSADFVTDSVEEDGVAVAIEHFLTNNS